jgi:hypothetical protein
VIGVAMLVFPGLAKLHLSSGLGAFFFLLDPCQTLGKPSLSPALPPGDGGIPESVGGRLDLRRLVGPGTGLPPPLGLLPAVTQLSRFQMPLPGYGFPPLPLSAVMYNFSKGWWQVLTTLNNSGMPGWFRSLSLLMFTAMDAWAVISYLCVRAVRPPYAPYRR